MVDEKVFKTIVGADSFLFQLLVHYLVDQKIIDRTDFCTYLRRVHDLALSTGGNEDVLNFLAGRIDKLEKTPPTTKGWDPKVIDNTNL